MNFSQVALEISNNSIALVENNYFLNSTTGFLCSYDSECNLNYNNFESCSNGINYTHVAKGEIKKNIIVNCYIGIYVSIFSNPNINWNNLLFCSNYKISILPYNGELTINAAHNWWGTTDASIIYQYILDEKKLGSGFSFGFVDYEPFENKIIDPCGIR